MSQSDLNKTGAAAEGSLCVPAEPMYLALVASVVRWFAERSGLSDEQTQDLDVAVDEACSNVIRHAYRDAERGNITVRCWLNDNGLDVTLLDTGMPLDLHMAQATAQNKREHAPETGGMGLQIIRELVDRVAYSRSEDGVNAVTLTKNFNHKQQGKGGIDDG